MQNQRQNQRQNRRGFQSLIQFALVSFSKLIHRRIDMADLRDAIIRLKPREHAGSRSADRFDYQKDWAICKLLQLHESSADYLIAFDVFDDVVVLNSEATPDRISFFQIKRPGYAAHAASQLTAKKTR